MPGRHAAESVRRSQMIKAAYHVAVARGLDGLTVRRVAAKAGVSTGLVLFHFETKEQLIIALLDWLLETTTVLHVGDEIARIVSPFERLLGLLRQEMDRLSSEPDRIRLFFDFWARGIRHFGIRSKMRRELARYRDAFRPMAEEVLLAAPERFRGVTAEGLAAVAVSFIKGCAVQSMIDPEHFDIAEYLAAAKSLVGQLAHNSNSLRLRPTTARSRTV
jgi:TetR/AcrR family transcriptional regulator, transcriptional repressor of bet genes